MRYGFLLVHGAVAVGSTVLAFALVAVNRSTGGDGTTFGVADDP